jgi:hypothetical protein
MIHRLASALALGATLALSSAAFANPPAASPSPHQPAKKSKAKHGHTDTHNDKDQKPAAPKK